MACSRSQTAILLRLSTKGGLAMQDCQQGVLGVYNRLVWYFGCECMYVCACVIVCEAGGEGERQEGHMKACVRIWNLCFV